MTVPSGPGLQDTDGDDGDDDAVWSQFWHSRLMGTVLDLRVGADDLTAREVDHLVTTEILRLEAIFSAFDTNSELSRWRRGAAPAGPELTEVLALAGLWQRRSGGAFNPLVGELSTLWAAAETCGVPPDEAELGLVAASIAGPRYRIADGAAHPIGDCRALNLNAIAKGWIVDRVVAEVAARLRPRWLLVNAGGDVRHLGSRPQRIGIENPFRPYDNEPPLLAFDLVDGAVATSGPARRGFRVGGRWFSHVIDPRSGRPADGAASVTVVAADAATADAAATAAAVLAAPDAVTWLASLDGVAGFVVDPRGRCLSTPSWVARFGPATDG